MQTPTQPGDVSENSKRLLTLAEVERLVGRRKTAIYSDLANPDSDFPRPVRISRSIRFVSSEVDAYIERLIERRDACQAEAA